VKAVPKRFPVGDHAVDTILIPLGLIEGEVIVDEEEYDQRSAYANGETKNVDKGKGFVTPKVADSDEKIALKHR